MFIFKSNPIDQACGSRAGKLSEQPQISVKTVKNPQSVMHFKKTAQFIMNMMPKKSRGEAGVNPQYWLEITDKKHRDRISLNGFDVQSGALW